MKMKYPIEAFALAIVVFSCHVQEAFLTGVLIIFLTILGMLIKDFLKNITPKWSTNCSVLLLVLSIDHAIVNIILNGVLKMELNKTSIFIQFVIALLVVKHIVVDDAKDYDRHLFESSVVYGFFVLLSFIREFISFGEIYGIKVMKLGFMTKGFQGVVFGLLFAGIVIAIVNGIFKYKADKNISLLIAIPIVIAEQPFLIRGIPEIYSIIISSLVTIVLLVSISETLQFSTIDKRWRNLPIELVSLSILYLSLIAL